MPKAQQNEDLGFHNDLPVLVQSYRVEKGARAVTRTATLVPINVKPAGDVVMSTHYHQTKETFANIMSKDDPGQLIGYERVVTFDMIGALPDTRAESLEELRRHEQAIADREDEEKAAKKGQFRLEEKDGD